MKKLYTLALTGILATGLTACNKQEVAEENQQTVAEQAKQNAEQTAQGGVTVDTPFVSESFPGQSVSAAYFTLTNHGGEDVEVTAVSSDVSAVTEFHTMEMKDSKMIMRKMDKVVIPANGNMALKQGGNHLMFIDLKKPLVEGDEVNVSIELSNGEKLELSADVAKSKDEMNHMHHDGHDMKDHEHNHDGAEHDHSEHDHKHDEEKAN